MAKKNKKENFIRGTWCLKIAYRGTNYCGWQRQKNSHKSVQEIVEKVLRKLFADPELTLHSSGRTDAGVHALEQPASFITDYHPSWTEQKLHQVLGGKLPPDIVLKGVEKWPDDLHARFSTFGKTYVYVIKTTKARNPFDLDLYYQHKFPIDAEKMIEAAAVLTGTHDFTAFSAKKKLMNRFDSTNSQPKVLKYRAEPKPVGNIRTIYDIEVLERDDKIFLIFSGSGFLYKMVRSLVGHLLWIGEGRCTIGDTLSLLKGAVRTNFVETAPARGLYLASVFYQRDLWQSYDVFKDSFFPFAD